MKAPPYLAAFDSASTFLRSLSAHLHGRGFPRLGLAPPGTEILAPIANLAGREPFLGAYLWIGTREAVPYDRTGEISVAEITRWVAASYPRRHYSAVMIGSSNGAVIHLCAALGIPWLPQTFLIPIRKPEGAPPPDRPGQEAAFFRRPAQALLDANPGVALHHMHDLNHDWLMLARIAYFRIKLQRLAHAYEDFLAEALEPNGLIFLVDCDLPWPAVELESRHLFQLGAYGGPPISEYLELSDRLAGLIARHGGDPGGWDAPQPNGIHAEAEWGFDSSLRPELEAFARRRGLRFGRLSFHRPSGLSPFTAEFYRQLWRVHGSEQHRLLVESFIVLDPRLTLETGACPFWLPFNDLGSARDLEEYLAGADPFDEIRMTLFSNAMKSLDQAPIERWRELLKRAHVTGAFAGVDERAYPRDIATYLRYHRALARHSRRRPPPAVGLPDLEAFLSEAAHNDRAAWELAD